MVIKSRSILLLNGVFQHQHDIFWITSKLKPENFDVLITFDEGELPLLEDNEDNFALCLNKVFSLIIRVTAEGITAYDAGARVSPEDYFGDVPSILPQESRRGCFFQPEDVRIIHQLRKLHKQEGIIITRHQVHDANVPFYSKPLRHYLDANKKPPLFVINNDAFGLTSIHTHKCLSAGRYDERAGVALYIAGESITCCQLCFR